MLSISCLSDQTQYNLKLLLGSTLLITYANFDNSIQVYIPLQKSSQSFVTKIKCQVNSNTTHDVLISKEVNWKSSKEICNGEPRKVNLGYVNEKDEHDPFEIQNNSLVHFPREPKNYMYGHSPEMALNWEVLSMFFSIHNIEPNWLDCNYTYGWYDDELGGWTGCMGKVWGTEY